MDIIELIDLTWEEPFEAQVLDAVAAIEKNFPEYYNKIESINPQTLEFAKETDIYKYAPQTKYGCDCVQSLQLREYDYKHNSGKIIRYEIDGLNNEYFLSLWDAEDRLCMMKKDNYDRFVGKYIVGYYKGEMFEKRRINKNYSFGKIKRYDKSKLYNER